MATAALSGTPTSIDDAESTANWGGDTFALEPDIKVEGSNSVGCVMSVTGNNDAYVTGTWDFSGTGSGEQHLRLWFNISFIGDLSSSNPIQVFLYDGTNTAYYYWDKASNYTGGWAQAVIYTGDSPDAGTVSKGSITRIGMRFVTSTKPRNVPANAWFDAWVYGDGYVVTGGTSGDKITWADIVTQDLASAYGIVSEVSGIYFVRGDIQLGSGATTTYFEMDTQVASFVEEQVSSSLYKIHGDGSACYLTFSDAVIRSAGTLTKDRFDFDVDETNLASVSITGSAFVNGGDVYFKSAQTVTTNIFNNVGQITHGAANMDASTVKNYEGAADTSALVYNINADPDGEMDEMIFSKGTASTHAIEFGSSVPATMTIRNIGFSGFNAADAQTDSTFYFADTGGTITLNLIGCTGNLSYKSAGATIVLIEDPVTVGVTVKDLATSALIENARVFLYVTSAAAGFPYDASVNITGTGTTATVSHSTHGLSTGDFIWIEGANEDVYNGVYSITYIDAGSYSYTTNETISTSPATGTITATFAFIGAELTNASGYVSDTRVVSADQPIAGWVRKSSASPYYAEGIISDTVDDAGGIALTVLLAKDE